MTFAKDTQVLTSLPTQIVRAASAMLRAHARRRAQRLALEDLLQMEAARLADLGITVEDVLAAAAAARHHAGSHLRERREANSTALAVRRA